MNLEEAVKQLQAGGNPVQILTDSMKDSGTMMAKMVIQRKEEPLIAVIVVQEDMCAPVLKALEALEDVYELEK